MYKHGLRRQAEHPSLSRASLHYWNKTVYKIYFTIKCLYTNSKQVKITVKEFLTTNFYYS